MLKIYHKNNNFFRKKINSIFERKQQFLLFDYMKVNLIIHNNTNRVVVDAYQIKYHNACKIQSFIFQ